MLESQLPNLPAESDSDSLVVVFFFFFCKSGKCEVKIQRMQSEEQTLRKSRGGGCSSRGEAHSCKLAMSPFTSSQLKITIAWVLSKLNSN